MIHGMGTKYITATLRKGISQNRAAFLIRVGLALGSLIIYAVATLVLNQPRYVQYDTERTSLAAAVSNAAYGAPIGTIYTGVLSPLWDSSRPMQQTFEETARGEVHAGSLLKVAMDGNGIGYVLFATLAMRLFGLHLSSLAFALITLMAVSTCVFLLRYRDDRLLTVPLYFLSLTIMLNTPLVSDPWFASQVPIGGIRYFSLVGIVPAMHTLLEFAEPRKVDPRTTIGNFILLGIQLLVLAIAIVVRSSAGYLLGAIGAGFLVVVRTYASNRASLRNIIGKGAFAAVLGALFLAVFILWIPKSYKESGRAMGLVWHRVLISLGANPAWPFGELRNIYQCHRQVAEGLVPGIVDRNGHCIWAAYRLSHGLSAESTADDIYDDRYETTLEKAFFDITRLYPVEVLETFVYYKPIMILSTMRDLISIDFARNCLATMLLLLMQVLNLILFVVCGAGGSPRSRTRLLAGPIVMLSVFALLPMIVAWSNGFTSADPLFYFFFGLGLVLAAAIDGIGKVSRRSTPGFGKPAPPE